MTIPAVFDVDQFCRNAQRLILSVPVMELPRVLDEQEFDAPASTQQLDIELQGRTVERSELPSYAGRSLLHVTVEGPVYVACVRCLTPVLIHLETERNLVLFDSDAQADAALLDNDRYDALTGGREFDLRALIEDEVLMALPADPAHDACPADALGALGLSQDQSSHTVAAIVPDDIDEESPNPFAALAGFRRH